MRPYVKMRIIVGIMYINTVNVVIYSLAVQPGKYARQLYFPGSSVSTTSSATASASASGGVRSSPRMPGATDTAGDSFADTALQGGDTVADTDSDTILGLEAGANDYIAKPFKFAVLLARIRAQLRQHEQSEDAVFTIGHYSFRPAQKLLVEEDGGKVRLTEKETAILKYLYRAEQKVITRDVLLEEVWGYNSGVTTHTLETHIYRLRQKIEKDPSNSSLLVTESGGYKLVP